MPPCTVPQVLHLFERSAYHVCYAQQFWAGESGDAGSSAEHEVDVGGVERLGMELVRGVDPEPFEHVGVLGVRLIGEGLAKIGVAPHPTAVLRRATALASEANGVAPAGIGREHLLEDDVVLPVIAEVVDVADALS